MSQTLKEIPFRCSNICPFRADVRALRAFLSCSTVLILTDCLFRTVFEQINDDDDDDDDDTVL